MGKVKQYDLIAVRDYYPDERNPGNSLWVYDQVKGLQNNGLNSLVVSPTPIIPFFIRSLRKYRYYPKPFNKITNYKGTDVIRPAYLKFPGVFLQNANNCRLTNVIFNAGKNYVPKLIHSHFGRNGVASIKLKKALNVPLVTYFYGDDVGVGEHQQFLRKFYQNLFIEGNLFIALSKDMKNDMIRMGFPENKIEVVHLGVDIDKFITKEKNNNNKFIFTIVGRFHKYKGGQDAISAFAKVHSIYNNAELHIVGDGPYIDKLQMQVKLLNVEKSVVFINNFAANNPRKVVLDEISNCDVFMLVPYQNEKGVKTGTPVVLMEAQACAKPCISTLYAGIPEVVINNKTGFLEKERDIDGIAKSMIKFIEKKILRSSFGKNARKHIINEFNQKKQIDKLADLYNELIGNYKL